MSGNRTIETDFSLIKMTQSLFHDTLIIICLRIILIYLKGSRVTGRREFEFTLVL